MHTPEYRQLAILSTALLLLFPEVDAATNPLSGFDNEGISRHMSSVGGIVTGLSGEETLLLLSGGHALGLGGLPWQQKTRVQCMDKRC